MIQTLSIISGLTGLIAFSAGALAWYRGSAQKAYAAQRDFEHLRRNQQQMADGLSTLIDEIRQHLRNQDKETGVRFDALHRELLDAKAMFYAAINKGQ